MKFQLETERLLLRELRVADLEGMFELDSNPEVHKYLGNKPIKTKAESFKIIESVISQYKKEALADGLLSKNLLGNLLAGRV